jgi:outer membrane protein insertion porin family
MFSNISNIRLLIILAISAVLYSCNATKHLKDGELLVVKNTIKIKSNLPSDEAVNLEYRLSEIAKQKPNKKNFLGQKARMNRYLKIQKKLAKKEYSDTSKIQKWLLGNYIEQPILYDRSLMEASTETMTYYLNNIGYFYADATADTIPHKHKPTIEVVYTANLGELLTIRNIKFETDDDSIQYLIPSLRAKSILKSPKPISKTVFSAEKSRITEQLQNMGFAYFYPDYIFFEGDTTEATLQADVSVTIVRPTDSTYHERYRIGNTYIFTQYDPVYFRPDLGLDTLMVEGYDGFYLIKEKGYDRYLVKPSPILNAFEFKKGDWYSADSYNQTRKQLSAIPIYRFVRVRSTPNPNRPGEMDFYIYMNPANDIVLSTDLELNYITGSSSNTTTINNLGIFGNVSVMHRNILKGAEVLNIGTTGGVELNLNQNNTLKLFNTIDIRLQADLTSPVIKSDNILNNAKTRFAIGYNYISRYLNYQINSFNFSSGFDWHKQNTRHLLNPAFINLLLPNIDPAFQLTLDTDPFLARSFDRQLVIGSNYSYTFTRPANEAGSSYNIRYSLEFAGNTINLIDRVFNPNKSFEFFNAISYSQYGRVEFDGNYTKKFGEFTAFATRFNFGLVAPYGNSDEVPYLKQFSAGGSSGVRAWQIRQIGPGAFFQPYPLKVITPYQAGNIKVEFNLEYRFMLLKSWSLQSAFFLDGGNVWLINDPDNLKREFRFDTFWNQLAVGSGYGFRMDLGFFIFRLDLGYKIMTPYKSELNLYNERFLPREWWKSPNYVIAIGYPF